MLRLYLNNCTFSLPNMLSVNLDVGILDQSAEEEEDEESTPVSPHMQPQSRTTTPADTPGVVAPDSSPIIYSPSDVSGYDLQCNGGSPGI